jgi:ketosteroid isomerase-like protein
LGTGEPEYEYGYIESVLELWHERGTLFEPGGQRATGKQQLRARMNAITSERTTSSLPRVEDVTVSGDLGAVLSTAAGTVTAKATGVVFRASACQVLTVRRIGGS